MMGAHNSVANRMIESCPGISVWTCICHSLHLCASDACKILLKRCEDLACNWILPKFTSLNSLFQSSSVVITQLHDKMVSTYKDLLMCFMKQDYVNKTPLHLINPENVEHYLPITQIYLNEKHTATELSVFLKNVVREWKLENKIFAVVTDNASNI
ncbi:DUF4371 domain-containing protein [Aphis craccivora]|uniref:DUF4371 domain-containing protein n=1 Tax=Aphis craccivora TaxID=307492 RepID=A0A6G0YES8_APHCR|nr:DUF4371 domain-containing protein [Aphis craccivora]